MFKHKLTVMLGILVLFSMVLSGCAAAVPAAQPAAPAAEGEASWWKTASQSASCEGVTIRGVSESTPPSNFARETLAPAFQAETGITVELETTSWDEMYNKAINDMQAGTGIYDFVYIEQDIIYQYLANNYLVNLTQLLADNPNLASSDFDFAKFTSFIDNFKDADGNIYGVPMEAFVKIYLYRLDLFNDPAIQEAFAAEYGYDLTRPPRTSSTRTMPLSSPSTAQTTGWNCGAPPFRATPATPPPSTNSSSRSHPPSASTTGASTLRTGKQPSKMAAA